MDAETCCFCCKNTLMNSIKSNKLSCSFYTNNTAHNLPCVCKMIVNVEKLIFKYSNGVGKMKPFSNFY